MQFHGVKSLNALVSLRLPFFLNAEVILTAGSHVTSPCHDVHVKTSRFDGWTPL